MSAVPTPPEERTSDPARPAPPTAHSLRHFLSSHPLNARGALKRFIRLLVVAIVVEYLVVPQLAGTRKSWQLLQSANNWWLLAALGLEVLSLLTYGLLTWHLLPRLNRPTYGRIMRIDLATLAVSHSVPAGSAVGLGLGYRLLTTAGVPGPSAAAAKATQAVGSAVVLNVLLGGALVATVFQHGFASTYGLVAVAGLAMLALAAVATLVLTRHEPATANGLSRLLGRLPFVSPAAVRSVVGDVANYLRTLTADRRLLVQITVIAAANWLLDAGALWACVRAFGHTLGPNGLLVPYGIANVLAAIPLTPAGLGVVEAFLIPSLVGFSVPRGVAILGVLAWRGMSYLLPIPAGYVAYLSLPSARSDRSPGGRTHAVPAPQTEHSPRN